MKRAHPEVKLSKVESSHVSLLQKWVRRGNVVADLCVDLAIGGTPFSFFDRPETRTLTSLALKGAGIKQEALTADKIRDGVIEKAKKLREVLKAKLKGRKVSLSSDFGSRHGVNFFCKNFYICCTKTVIDSAILLILGMMVQIEENGLIETFCLGCWASCTTI